MRRPTSTGTLRLAARRAIGCCAALAALAGCGSTAAPGGPASPPAGAPSSSAPASSPTATTSPTDSATANCRASSLRVTLDTSAAGAAAGSAFFPLNFVNTSAATCRLTGYPAVAFASGASGHQIGAAAVPDRTMNARRVLLGPGATAHAWLQVVNAMDYPPQQCRLVTATGLRVRPPGTTRATFVRHTFPACAAAKPGGAVLTIQPVQPGRARRGTAH